MRIPVTSEQKALVVEAARRVGVDMATWARPLLLQAAKDVLNNVEEARFIKE